MFRHTFVFFKPRPHVLTQYQVSDLSSYDSYTHAVCMTVDAIAYTTFSILFFVVHKFSDWHDTSISLDWK